MIEDVCVHLVNYKHAEEDSVDEWVERMYLLLDSVCQYDFDINIFGEKIWINLETFVFLGVCFFDFLVSVCGLCFVGVKNNILFCV